nr:hypothetical protein I308_06078 [Cryptococcus tetragattii IND107]
MAFHTWLEGLSELRSRGADKILS